MQNLSPTTWRIVVLVVALSAIVGVYVALSDKPADKLEVITATPSTQEQPMNEDTSTNHTDDGNQEGEPVTQDSVGAYTVPSTPPSDLVIEELAIGDGAEAVSGQRVTVHYSGRLLDGTPFDSSVERGVPFQFVLGGGQVIKGWDQGVVGMRMGGQRLLIIPPHLGYGERGIGPIPPGATLVFEVELLNVDGG